MVSGKAREGTQTPDMTKPLACIALGASFPSETTGFCKAWSSASPAQPEVSRLADEENCTPLTRAAVQIFLDAHLLQQNATTGRSCSATVVNSYRQLTTVPISSNFDFMLPMLSIGALRPPGSSTAQAIPGLARSGSQGASLSAFTKKGPVLCLFFMGDSLVVF